MLQGPPPLLQEDSWARPPGGHHSHAEWQAWLDKHRLDKDHLTVALATLCDLVKRELEGDLTIHREHVLPMPTQLPVRPPCPCPRSSQMHPARARAAPGAPSGVLCSRVQVVAADVYCRSSV